MKNNIRLMVIVILLSFLTAGCLPPIRPASTTLNLKARQFSPSPGRAAIYVIRPGQFVASGSPLPVMIDHEQFGQLPVQSFLYGEVLPREHILEFKYPGVSSSHRFKAEEGKCYFILVKAGLTGFSVETLSDEEGKKLVDGYELSGENKFDNEDEGTISPINK